MANLFSIFDPVTLALPLNWASVFLAVLVIPAPFWGTGALPAAFKKTSGALSSEFSAILGSLNAPGHLILPIGAFFLIWVNNALGLAPYIFTATAHLTLTLSMALPLWLGHVLFAWVKTPENMLAHLVPLGSPSALSPFMVIIELVSSIIRPLTLSVRLAANMVAGHLLMVLLSTPAASANLSLASLIVMALLALAILESAVATIQAYVFSILSVLYVNEVNSDKLI